MALTLDLILDLIRLSLVAFAVVFASICVGELRAALAFRRAAEPETRAVPAPTRTPARTPARSPLGAMPTIG
jgi:hypothetical protein